MDTLTINKLLKNERCYLGTFSRDTLPRSIKNNFLFIVNTDPSTKPGEHWVAISKNSDGTGEYFDSYGLPPLHKEFITFMYECFPKGWNFNNIPLQCLSCITCGHYCVVYVKFRCHGYSTQEFIKLFTNDLNFNDTLIKLYSKY